MKRSRQEGRQRRHFRARKKISGTAERPRLCVYQSLKYIYAQVIDDTRGRTLAAASSLKLKADQTKGAAAEAIGKQIAEQARAAGIHAVVFDRGGYLYHGNVKALAEAARAGGLVF